MDKHASPSPPLPALCFHLFAPVLIKTDCVQTAQHSVHTLGLDTFISEHYDSAGSVPLGHSTSHCNWADSKYWKVLTLKEQFSLFMCCPVKELSFLLFGCLYDKRENTFQLSTNNEEE